MNPFWEQVGYVTMFICGIGLLLAIVLSLVYHRISAKTNAYWEDRRKLLTMDEGDYQPHPSELHEFEEEREQLRAKVAEAERLLKREEVTRWIGLVLLYASTLAGGVALVIGGYRAFV